MKFNATRLKKLSKLRKLKVKKENATRVALAGGTILTAAAIGFFMQSGTAVVASAVEEPRAKLVAENIAPKNDALVAALLQNDATHTLPDMPAERFAEMELPAQPIVLAVATDVPTKAMPSEEATPILGCDIQVQAKPAVAAMVNLSIDATCLPGDRVTVNHAGLVFTEVLDPQGMLEISVPAMAQTAEFLVTFSNGYTGSATADVGSLQFYDRVAVQWTGETGLQIHALEFGATYGEEGHVWYGNERDLTAVIGGRGGFLLRLGDGFSSLSKMADVYTFPTLNAAQGGEVQLTVEAEVNGANCGRAVSATSLQVRPGDTPIKKSLNVEIPSCSATGDFLVLQNLLEDLTFAQKG